MPPEHGLCRNRLRRCITKKKTEWNSQTEYRSSGKKRGQDRKQTLWRLLPKILRLLALLLIAAAVALNYKANHEVPVYPEIGSAEGTADAAGTAIPDYSGEDVIELNGNLPYFTETELSETEGEHFSELDELRRCGAATAMLDRSMMPLEEREPLLETRPSGWKQALYPDLVDTDPPALYNRCHLIAHAMTGQNDNEKNLITGTRYMNAVTMLAYEEQVLDYLDHTDHHVLYRVTPYFKGSELVARGVEIEARSVEDGGRGICFHVFVYNIQPGVEIDYQTGESRLAQES